MTVLDRNAPVRTFSEAAIVAAVIVFTVALAFRKPATESAPLPIIPFFETGTEVVAVLVVQSTCSYCNDPALAPAFRVVAEAYRDSAAHAGKGFATAGVSLDPEARTGVEFIAALGEFAEISAGRGWLNTGSLEYIVRNFRGALAAPQLLIIERDLVIERTDMRVSSDRLVARYVGLTEIVQASVDLAEGH